MRQLRVILAVVVAGLVCGARPAAAQTTITGGSELLSQAYADQLGTWLGEGPITITRIWSRPSSMFSLGGTSAAAFHTAADGKGRTFTVVEAAGPLGTRVIGGYNPHSWDMVSFVRFTPNDADRTAFLFNLSQGFKLDQVRGDGPTGPGSYQTYNTGDGPFWGPYHGGLGLWPMGLSVGGATAGGTYGYGSLNAYGESGNTVFDPLRVEVFTIGRASDAPAVPEPGALALFLPALAAVGVLRGRRA